MIGLVSQLVSATLTHIEFYGSHPQLTAETTSDGSRSAEKERIKEMLK
jgi:hypothetical protein